NWRTPISPTMRVKKVRGSSTIGWKPTKPPIRGYISSTGIVACPHPNVWTHRPAALDSAMTVAAAWMFSNWVASMRSITPRAWPSHSSASIIDSSTPREIRVRDRGTQLPPQKQEQRPLRQQSDRHYHEGRLQAPTVSQHTRQVRQETAPDKCHDENR